MSQPSLNMYLGMLAVESRCPSHMDANIGVGSASRQDDKTDFKVVHHAGFPALLNHNKQPGGLAAKLSLRS
jgi:hypothetical protein